MHLTVICAGWLCPLYKCASMLQVHSDPVGYGFVIRGDSPTYVQAVDPMGPGTVAGLKVRLYTLYI